MDRFDNEVSDLLESPVVPSRAAPHRRPTPRRRPVTRRRSLTERNAKDGDVEKKFIQYVQEGNTFSPAGQIRLVKELPPCIYEVHHSMSGIYFEKVAPKTDELLRFDGSVMESILEEVDRYWGLKSNFDRLGFLHKRGVLMYGPPGCGKTCAIHQVGAQMTENGDALMMGKDIGDVTTALHQFRQVEPDRRIVVVLEDMDEYIGYSERDTLQLLDGANSVDNVLILGTTNYIEKFPPRLKRPGRFDRVVEVSFPPVQGRRKYLETKLDGIAGTELIGRLAEETDGFSFGHLRELIIAGFAFEEDLDETIHRLRNVDYQALPPRDEESKEDAPIRESLDRKRAQKRLING